MADILKWFKFSEIDLGDGFFDSLKADYLEFPDWFSRKAKAGEEALVAKDDEGITAFLYLKREDEAIALSEGSIPTEPRLKIGTFKLSDRMKGNRQGEGTLGIALWKWQQSGLNEIYVTVFPKHDVLIMLFERFGFSLVGHNSRGEGIYVKDRRRLDFSDSFKAFPFIKKGFGKAFVLPINDDYHDKLFPYSEVARNTREVEEIAAGNGISKVFIGFPSTPIAYKEGKPILVYRIHTGNLQKTYASCATSFCTIQKTTKVKSKGVAYLSYDSFRSLIGNKAVFSDSELQSMYRNKPTIIVVELVYTGFFGKGSNITHHWLKEHNLFEGHPYSIEYSEEEFEMILKEGSIDVQNAFVD